MKIAYLFHGHARTWLYCYSYFFNNIYTVMPGDIFIHTWHNTNAKMGSYWNNNSSKLSDELATISAKPIDINAIHKIYQPKYLGIELDPGIQHFKKYFNKQIPDIRLGAKNMLASAKKIFNIARQHDNYDKYFSTRLDILYYSSFDTKEICANHMLVPFTRYSHDNRYVFDVWNVGDEEQTEKQTNFYDAIDDYWYRHTDDYDHYIYEEALRKYYNDIGLKTKTSSLKYCLPRINGKVTFFSEN